MVSNDHEGYDPTAWPLTSSPLTTCPNPAVFGLRKYPHLVRNLGCRSQSLLSVSYVSLGFEGHIRRQYSAQLHRTQFYHHTHLLLELWLAPALKTARTVFMPWLYNWRTDYSYSYFLSLALALPAATTASALLAPANAPLAPTMRSPPP